MKRELRPLKPQLILLFSLMALMVTGATQSYSAEFSEVEKILGVSGQTQEGVTVFSFPRHDLKMKIGGDSVPTAIGFGSWTGWKEIEGGAMVMGDLVLVPKEINTVISALAEANVMVTALHNHFLWEDPRIMYMHIYGMGPASPMATGIRNALNKTGTPRSGPTGGTSPPTMTLDTKRLEQIIGHPGKAGGGVFKIIIGRPGAKMDGIEMTASMGLNTWAAFAGTKSVLMWREMWR